LSDYFVSISTIYAVNVCLPNCETKTDEVLQSFQILEIEFIDTLSSLVINTSAGPDEVNIHIRKECKTSICTPLCIPFNRSLS
jgi:hypothetical protein